MGTALIKIVNNINLLDFDALLAWTVTKKYVNFRFEDKNSTLFRNKTISSRF